MKNKLIIWIGIIWVVISCISFVNIQIQIFSLKDYSQANREIITQTIQTLKVVAESINN